MACSEKHFFNYIFMKPIYHWWWHEEHLAKTAPVCQEMCYLSSSWALNKGANDVKFVCYIFTNCAWILLTTVQGNAW